jgi:phage tail-like protein
MSNDNALAPLQVFRFQVDFEEDPLIPQEEKPASVALCSGAFSECTGLEATMEPKVIKEGGRNYGPVQRAGPVTFATVILKRGMTSTRHLWKWFELISGGAYAYRLTATITMSDAANQPILKWKLEKAMPIKFKAADLNAKGTEVGIEELHLAHEGISLVS